MKRFLENSLYPAKWYQENLNFNYDYFEQLIQVGSEIVTDEGTIFTSELKDTKINVEFKGCLISIYAYNNYKTIEKQLTLLQDNIIDFEWNFAIICFDDSTDLDTAEKIKTLVISQHGTYVKVPRLRKNKKIYYHNQAINYSWYNVLQYISCSHIGMLDHDIFPFKKVDLWSKITKYDIYCKKGDIDLPDEETSIWYPWPGFCFFKKSIIKEFNFFFDRVFINGQWYIMDTGGAMFRSNFLNRMEDYKRNLVPVERVGDEENFYELIDESWIHLRDLSNWSGNTNFDKLTILSNYIK